MGIMVPYRQLFGTASLFSVVMEDVELARHGTSRVYSISLIMPYAPGDLVSFSAEFLDS